MNFTTTIYNVLIMFFYMAPAFILCKFGKVSQEHLKTVSTILMFICSPALIINSFQEVEYNTENIKHIGEFLLTSLILHIVSVLILFLIFYKKFKDDPQYRVLTLAGTLGNVGFFGQPLLKALYPNEKIVSCYSSLMIIAMAIVLFTFGVYAITLDKKYISPLGILLNPSTLSLIVAIIIFFCKWHFPKILGDAISILGKMSTPLCMHVLAIRLATIEDLKSLFLKPLTYVGVAIKLIALPLFFYLVVYFIPFFSEPMKGSCLILGGCPSGSMILAVAEVYNSDQELAGNSILLSQIICIVTLPVVSLLLDVK